MGNTVISTPPCIRCWDMAVARKMRPRSTWKIYYCSRCKEIARFLTGTPISDVRFISGSTAMLSIGSTLRKWSLHTNVIEVTPTR